MNPAPATIRQRVCAPSFGLSLVVCGVVTVVISWLRLVVFHDRILPLGNGLPLLLCLWNRDLRLLYGMAVAFSWVSFAKIHWVMPPDLHEPSYEKVLITSQLLNIWVVAGVIHGLIRVGRRVEQHQGQLDRLNHQLAEGNEKLASRNQELAARQEEIIRQHQELQRQAEELQQQAHATLQQRRELQQVNLELMRKDRGLRTLLDSGRWMRADMNESLVMNGICQAAVQVLGDGVEAAAVAVERHGTLGLMGDYGVDLHAAPAPGIAFEQSFTWRVWQADQSYGSEDVTEELERVVLPPAAASPAFRSALGTPIRVEAKILASLEVYAREPRSWQEQDVRLVEWLAAQAAIALQAIRAHHELEQRRRAAEEASIRKTRFFAAVSHDVRTPANAISLLAEVIEKCANDPHNCHLIPTLAKNLWSSARAMVELVSGVLEITRYDSADPGLEVTHFSLCELIRTEAHQALPLAESKGLKLRWEAPDGEVWLASDRLKLARVLSNLISNAIKFTETGEVKIHWQVAADGEVRVSVIDTGIGIPGDQLDKVFDEFVQLRNPQRNRDHGSGLGLAICRRLVDALGCQIHVTSAVGHGSTFTVTIPASKVMAGPPSDNPSDNPPDPLPES